jgi:hypothetical protein
VGPDKQGLLFGALGSIKSLALLCGALLGGTIYSTLQRAVREPACFVYDSFRAVRWLSMRLPRGSSTSQ